MTRSTNIKDFIDSLPDDRKKAVTELRKTINKNLPTGFLETIAYNSLAWSVPHSSYPAGYHCDPSKPLMLMCLAANKGGISLHHMGLYGSTPLLKWFQSEWPNHSLKKLDMGKACIRLKKLDDIPLDLIGKLASKLTPQQWVEQYEHALGARSAKR